jgi:hypothetical protein
MTTNNFTIPGLKRAVESRNSAALQAYYADNAVLTIIDSVNTPSKPRIINGKRDIGVFLDDVCSRDMVHAIDSGIVDGKTLAYVERCQYADGTRVVASNTAELGPNGIVRQTIVQAWDS